MKTVYRVHLIKPIEGEMVYKASHDDTNSYSSDPYTPHEHGVFIFVQANPYRVRFIPWTNITHVEITKSS